MNPKEKVQFPFTESSQDSSVDLSLKNLNLNTQLHSQEYSQTYSQHIWKDTDSVVESDKISLSGDLDELGNKMSFDDTFDEEILDKKLPDHACNYCGMSD